MCVEEEEAYIDMLRLLSEFVRICLWRIHLKAGGPGCVPIIIIIIHLKEGLNGWSRLTCWTNER